MTAVHEHTIRLPVLPSRVQLTCNGIYVALPHSRAVVKVWSLQDITCKPLELEGHSKAVTGLAFSHRSHPTLLCSAADDYIIVWNVEKARTCLGTGQQIRGTIIGKTLGYIQYVSFKYDDTQVAVCSDKDVYILDAKQDRIDTILEGHSAMVNCAEFCPHYTATVVTAADDRTFKVWDILSGTMVYQSTIISSSPFISLAMNPVEENFALGTADGQVRVYDLTDGNGFRSLHHLDVTKVTSKIRDAKDAAEEAAQGGSQTRGPLTISSRPSWQRHDSGPTDFSEAACEDETETGCSILSLLYTWHNNDRDRTPTPAKLSFLQHDDSLVSDLLESAPTLAIGTTSGILQVNAKTLEPMQYVSFKEPMVSNSVLVHEKETISLSGNMVLSPCGAMHNKVCAVVGALFQCEVHILHIYHPNQTDSDILRSQLAQSKKLSPGYHGNVQGAGESIATVDNGAYGASQDEPVLSVLSCGPLMPNSPLKAELTLKAKETKPSNKGKVKGTVSTPAALGGLDKKGHIVDKQPIVFHDKVKSSGYSKEAPRRAMFQPKTNVSQAAKSLPPTKPTKTSSVKPIIKEYPMTADPPTHMVKKLDIAERPTAVNTLQFSSDGQSVACALSNTSAQVFKLPLSGKGCAFAGHTGIVSSAQWSQDGKWLITSSDDKTAAVWSLGLSDPVMTFTLTNNNFGADKEGGVKPEKDNPCFNKPVRFGQFYYMDKFIMLTCGSSFSLYKYHLDTVKSDIKRYLSSNRYKVVKTFQMTDCHQITAFSAVNNFHSYLALCSGSNKAIEVFDLNAAKSIRIIPDSHTKAPHAICQNQGSAYTSHSPEAYDLFVTAAAGDCIKLWDLRSNRCVRRYEGHCNRAQPCGLAISPCSRFIATGSEDRSAYIFDIRSGTYLHKLLGHTDTVSDVAFHPLHPQLLTATLDGKLRLFVNK